MTVPEQMASLRRAIRRLLTERLGEQTSRPFMHLLALKSIADGVRSQAAIAERMLVDAPSVSRLVARLRQAVLAKIGELEHTVSLVRAGDRAAAVSAVETGRGRALMDEIREVSAVLTADQDTEWARLTTAIQHRERALVGLDAAGVLLTALLAWFAGLVIRRALRALRSAEAK